MVSMSSLDDDELNITGWKSMSKSQSSTGLELSSETTTFLAGNNFFSTWRRHIKFSNLPIKPAKHGKVFTKPRVHF